MAARDLDPDPEDTRAQLDEAGAALAAARANLAAVTAAAKTAATTARLRGWALERIAGRLDVTRTTVQRWLEEEE